MAEQRLIDAEALYKKVLGRPVTNADGYGYINHNRVLEMINNEPTVEAKPVVHARWEECDWIEYDDGYGERIWCPKSGLRCSNCTNVFKKELLWKENYCPNCGAQMDEEEG